MLRLLIADESHAVRKVGNRILTDFGFDVAEAPSALDALAKCDTSLPAVLIVDSAMDGALDLIANIRAMPQGRCVRILYSVVEVDLKRLMAGKHAGADDFLLKPFDTKVLAAMFAEMRAAAATAA